MRQHSANAGSSSVPPKNAEAAARSEFATSAMLSFLLVTALVFLPSTAHAATDPLSLTICTVVKWFVGPLGKTIATLGILVLGVGALMGKISWGMAITVAVGVSIMFSGGEVVRILTDKQNVCAAVVGPSPTAMSDILCNLSAWANDPVGRSLGTLAIVFLGIGALFAKISYPQALIAGAGIGLFYRAERLVDLLYGDKLTAYTCSPTSAAA